jgi:hypothetical protein
LKGVLSLVCYGGGDVWLVSVDDVVLVRVMYGGFLQKMRPEEGEKMGYCGN